jgi:hypothetical protein
MEARLVVSSKTLDADRVATATRELLKRRCHEN